MKDMFIASEKEVDSYTLIDNENNEKETLKQNMSLDGFTTTKDLDLQLETILKSIEPDVMAVIKKIKH